MATDEITIQVVDIMLEEKQKAIEVLDKPFSICFKICEIKERQARIAGMHIFCKN